MEMPLRRCFGIHRGHTQPKRTRSPHRKYSFVVNVLSVVGMRVMYQPTMNADNRLTSRDPQFNSVFTGGVVLILLWFYLPLEALDRDAIPGFDEANLTGCSYGDASDRNAARAPDYSLAGPPMWRVLPSLTRALAAAFPPALNSPAGRQARLLLASRLCPRARIADLPSTSQPQFRNSFLACKQPPLLRAPRALARALVFHCLDNSRDLLKVVYVNVNIQSHSACKILEVALPIRG